MSDWSKNAEDTQADEFAPKRPKASTQPTAAVLPVLQNWQVLDMVDADALESDGNAIDGEATVVNEHTEAAAPEKESGEEWSEEQRSADDAREETFQRPSMAIADQLDPTILVTLETDQRQVLPGEETCYNLTILNNGTETATYQILVEGWITEAWLGAPLPQVELARGARKSITVPIRAPHSPQTTAGDRALAFVVRRTNDTTAITPSLTRRGAILTILPYTNLTVGEIEPKSTTLSLWQKQATVTIPVTNHSNYPVAVRLQVRQPASMYACTIEIPYAKAGQHATQNAAQRKRATVLIPPGNTITSHVKIRTRQQPLLALRTAPTSLQLITSTVECEALPYQPWTRTVAVPVTTKPLLGLWQLTSLVGLLAMILVGMGVAGMVALLIVSISMRQAEAVTPPTSQVAVAPQPIIVAYIQAPMPQNMGQRAGQSMGKSAAVPVGAPSSSTPIVVQLPAAQGAPIQVEAAPAAMDNAAVPILSVDQISAPGSALPAPTTEQAAIVTDGVGAPATPAPMTYATMFHEVARRYDLNWRVLAAQAYVESGFDSVALGAQGDLGLMQIHPATWREWAPMVEVADPFDSYSNVLVAAAYFDYLRTTLSKRGHPEVEWTLVAYNWGIDKVLQYLESGQEWQALPTARQEYATEILRLAETIPADN